MHARQRRPNDGLVALQSALAKNVGDPGLPHQACYTVDDTHSIFVSDQAKLSEQTALTWDARVLELLHSSIENARS